MDSDVVIAGAGPAGLLLASELRLGGVRTIVLERELVRDESLRASGITRLSVQALDRRGLLGRLRSSVAKDVPGSPELPLDDGIVPARQQLVEQVLEEHAVELGADLRRGHELVGLCQDDTGVTVDVRSACNETYSLRAAYLVGCDGGRSTVRKGAGFPTFGSDPTITGYQALVTVQPPPGPVTLPPGWHRTPTGIAAWAPGRTRIVSIEYSGPPADRDAPVTLAEVQASLRRTSGMELTLTDPQSLARFTDNVRLAQMYRLGRVLLAGDAAHVHPPHGGQGLNLSLLDAANLGWKLAATIQGWAPPTLLDTYHTERYPVARRVVRNALADVALLNPDPRMTPAYQLYSEIKSSPQIRPYLLDMISMTYMAYDMGVPEDRAHPLLGRAAPELSLETPDGQTTLVDLQRTGRGVLLDLVGHAELRDAAAGWADRVRVVTGRCKAREDINALLVRPDGYTAWIYPRDGEPGPGRLVDALAKWFGCPRQ